MHGMFNKSHMSTYLFQMRVLSRPNWNHTMLFYAGYRATTSYLLLMMHTAQVASATMKEHKTFLKKCIGTKSCWSMMRLVHVTIHRHRILLRCVLKHERCSRQKKKTEKYDDQIDTIGQILEKECDEHDHISPFLTAKMRRVPLRLREEMQMELLQIVSKYINYAWNLCFIFRHIFDCLDKENILFSAQFVEERKKCDRAVLSHFGQCPLTVAFLSIIRY